MNSNWILFYLFLLGSYSQVVSCQQMSGCTLLVALAVLRVIIKVDVSTYLSCYRHVQLYNLFFQISIMLLCWEFVQVLYYIFFFLKSTVTCVFFKIIQIHHFFVILYFSREISPLCSFCRHCVYNVANNVHVTTFS